MIVVRGFEGKRSPPVAIAFVHLDGTDLSIGNCVDERDLSSYEAALKKLTPGSARFCLRIHATAGSWISAFLCSD